MNTLWRHSSACALAAEWICAKGALSAVRQTVFIGALVHDIGKLFLLRVLDQMGADSGSEAVSPVLIVEVLERAHPEVGHRLLASWNLPDVYRTIVRDHHVDAPDPSNIPLQIVRLANHACTKIGASLHPDPSMALDALPEVIVLGLSDIAIAELEILLEDIEARAA
jgi:putative nucleotidyltransferase with HDIG domain